MEEENKIFDIPSEADNKVEEVTETVAETIKETASDTVEAVASEVKEEEPLKPFAGFASNAEEKAEE